MKLIINIPEETYKNTCDEKMLPPDVKNVVEAIKNGTPLPKRYGRLIDADEYKKKVFRKFPCSDRDDSNIRRLTEMAILNAPTIVEADKGD